MNFLPREEFGHVSLSVVRKFADRLPALLDEIFQHMELMHELHLPGGSDENKVDVYSLVFTSETPADWFERICNAARELEGNVEYVGKWGARHGRLYRLVDLQQMELPNGVVVVIANRGK